MKRLLLIGSVTLLLVLAGCADGVTTDDPTVETDGELEDDDSSGPDDAAAADDGTGSTATDDGNAGDDADATDDPDPDDADGTLEIHHIDVGQADATLLIEPAGETMLVDSGDWRRGGAEVIDYLDAEGVDRIDHLVATHGHADHIGGHDEIVDHYETERDGIGTAYDSGVAHTSQTYNRYLDAIEAHDVDLLLVEDGDQFAFGDTTVDVRNPPAGDSGDDLHYNSVTLTVQFGEFSYLTTGDAEADAEQRLVDDHGDDLEADAYQAGHHGSSTSSTPAFVDRVAPDVVVISSAHDSQYGHPHDEVLEDFADRGIVTYWTAVHGHVVLTTDGDSVTLEPEREFSTDARDLLEEKPADDADEPQTTITPSIDGVTAPLAG